MDSLERAAADFVRPYKWLAIGVVALICLLATCAGWSQYRAGVHAQEKTRLETERDSSRVRSARHDSIARDRQVRASALAYEAHSLERMRHRSDSIATTALAALRAKPALDTTDVLALRQRVHELEAVLALHVTAVADSRQVAPAYDAAVTQYEAAIDTAMLATHESQRADTLSQALGEQAERSAHWRGVKQGVKGTIITATLLTIVGALLHAGGKL